jgi:hypothetical protein
MWQIPLGGLCHESGATRPFAERKRIVELALRYRLPAIYYPQEFVDDAISLRIGELMAEY